MKLLHIADILGVERWYAAIPDLTVVLDADVLALSGNLICADTPAKLRQSKLHVTALLRDLRIPTIVAPGTHDEKAGDWLQALRRPPYVAVEEAAEVLDLSQDVTIEAWPLTVPNPNFSAADIAICHLPPLGSEVAINLKNQDEGDPAIAGLLDEEDERPWLLLCGHTHRPKHWITTYQKTWVVNPGFDAREKEPRCVLIDTTKRTAAFYRQGREQDRVTVPDLRQTLTLET